MLTDRQAARLQRVKTIEQMLMYGERYQTIIAELAVSSRTIARVARKMRDGVNPTAS